MIPVAKQCILIMFRNASLRSSSSLDIQLCYLERHSFVGSDNDCKFFASRVSFCLVKVVYVIEESADFEVAAVNSGCWSECNLPKREKHLARLFWWNVYCIASTSPWCTQCWHEVVHVDQLIRLYFPIPLYWESRIAYQVWDNDLTGFLKLAEHGL